MNGYDILVSTLERFEQNLLSSETITTVYDLANISGYSSHHLSRLFFSHTQLKLKEYMQGRLLCCLIEEALTNNVPFSSLILDYGFKDYETFFRACKHHYNRNPSQIRKEGLDGSLLQKRIYPSRNERSQEIPAQYITEGRITLCGLSFFVGPETRSFHCHWQKFTRYQKSIKRQSGQPTTYQYTAWHDSDGGDMTLLCAQQVEPGVYQQPIFTCRTIEPCTYVRFVHRTEVTEIRETYQYIYGTYFAWSNDQIIGNWELQRYSNETTDIEILIPVKTRILDPNQR